MPASRKHPRLKRAVRKTVKWGGAGLTVLLLVVWIGSGWRGATWTNMSYGGVLLVGGRIVVCEPLFDADPNSYNRVSIETERYPWGWWFDWGVVNGNRYWQVPLWLPALLSLLATAAAWRADAKYLRRVREGACPACGYDRAGLAAGSLCPECGKQPEAR